MQNYGGDLIYSARDDEGVLEVVDAFGVRSLHFGTSPKQSAMSLHEPERLKLAYARAMLGALLFADAPERALLVGLGGGSLARFLLEHYPRCQVEAVERRAEVARIAHAYFGLPRDKRLIVHINDGRVFVEDLSLRAEQAYDLILVDAYDHLGMDQSVNAEGFFQANARLLRAEGALSMNLWGTHAVSLKRSLDLFRQFFPDRAYRLAVPNRGNIVGFGLGERAQPADPKKLVAKAKEMEGRLGLEMPYFLRGLQAL
jgi:spermidine synthase